MSFIFGALYMHIGVGHNGKEKPELFFIHGFRSHSALRFVGGLDPAGGSGGKVKRRPVSVDQGLDPSPHPHPCFRVCPGLEGPRRGQSLSCRLSLHPKPQSSGRE